MYQNKGFEKVSNSLMPFVPKMIESHYTRCDGTFSFLPIQRFILLSLLQIMSLQLGLKEEDRSSIPIHGDVVMNNKSALSLILLTASLIAVTAFVVLGTEIEVYFKCASVVWLFSMLSLFVIQIHTNNRRALIAGNR